MAARHLYLLFTLVIFFLMIFWMESHGAGYSEIDRVRYEEGKNQYTLMERHSHMPKYGTCWKGAITSLERGCKTLTDEVQSRLALAYLNCFLEVQGRPTYQCDETMSFEQCTVSLEEADRGSLTTFFTHTQSICYFLESQVWQDETQETIHKLARNSELVADQLESASKLQAKIMEKQWESLENQQKILDSTMNLSSSISASSESLKILSSDLKATSLQQRLLVDLQTKLLGEISGFYSVVYYVLAMIIAYIVTSTTRTSSSRLWLFFVITSSFVIEWCVMSGKVFGLSDLQADWNELKHHHLWLCRKTCAVLCSIVLVINIYRYQDINAMNNRLLRDIKDQNTELHKLLLGRTFQIQNGTPNGNLLHSAHDKEDSTGYESDPASSSSDSCTNSSFSTKTDRSYHPLTTRGQESDSESDPEDYSTPASTLDLQGSYGTISESSSGIRNRSGSPWMENQGFKGSMSLPTVEQSSTKYNLRSRGKVPTENSMTRQESPATFAERLMKSNKMFRKHSELAHKSLDKEEHFSDSTD